MSKEDLLEKWLKEELTPAEKKEFLQEDDYALNQSILDNAKHFKASHFSEINTFKEFETTYQKEKQVAQKLNWLKPMLRIASVFVIAFGIYFSFFSNNATQVQTLLSEKITVELPDHSKVTLNAASQIEYNKGDWDEKRSLFLEGEAYFNVAKGEVFDVVTSQGTVTVVGTSFNVKQRDTYFEVQCFEGIVNVASGKRTKQLLAGDVFQVLDDSFIEEKTKFSEPSWIQNRSYFKAIPLQEVIAEMERQFNISILLENVDTTRKFTGGFTHKSIEKALISVTQPMHLTFKNNASNQVVIYGNKK